MTVDMKLPDPPPAKKESRLLGGLTLLVALAILVVVVLDSSLVSPAGADAKLDRVLATALEERTLHHEAAEMWEKLAESADEPSLMLFRAGRSRMLAGEHERAIRDFLASENRGLPEALRGDSDRFVLECYAVLGKFDVRNAALKARTGSEEETLGKVIARLGGEEIRREELAEAVRDEETRRLAESGALDRKSLGDAVAARMSDPASLVLVMRKILSQRALALEALARDFEGRPEVQRRMASLRREVLGNLLLQERLLAAGSPSDDDLRDYYDGHRSRFALPAVVRFSWAPAGGDGSVPGTFAKVESRHARGDAFPDGRGASTEADAALFALEKGEITAKPISIGGTPMFLRLDEKQAARQIPFEGAMSRVREELSARRRADAMSRLMAEVSERHPVEILDAKLREAMSKEGDAPGR